MKAWPRFVPWPHFGWSICWAAIARSRHLLTEWNVQHSSRMHARTYLKLNISVKQWPANLLCKCFKGHKNMLRGEFELISLVWFLRKSQGTLRGGRICDFAGRKLEEMSWSTVCCKDRSTPAHLPPRQSVSAQQPLNTMLRWRGVKSLRRWHSHLSQDFS